MAEPLDYLLSLHRFGIKLGLDNIRRLCEAMDHPERSFAPIIVAGTNGKGSVAALLDTALRAAGYATGRFTSPHLVDLAERFVIGGQAVAPDVLAEETERLRVCIDALLADGRLGAPPTFFEATTAIALSLFRRAGIQVGVLEVGMGGRFDATNVVTAVAAAIPTIDLDHQEHLGSTLAAIAFEKAGVIKPDTLVVTGETKPEPIEVLRRICEERGAHLVEAAAGVDTTVELKAGVTELEIKTDVAPYGPISLGLQGRHQARNALVAVRLLEHLEGRGLPVPRDAILTGLTETRWPGRLELMSVGPGRAVLLDAAHNVASVEAFEAYVTEVWPSGLPLVVAILRDKDIGGMARALRAAATHVVCAPLNNPRALSPDALARQLGEARPDLPVTTAASLSTALDTAWTHGGVIGAVGSVFLVGEVMEHLELQR